MTTRNAAVAADSIANRKEIKRQRRDAQLAERARMEQADRTRRQLIWGAVAVVGVLALGALGWWLFGPTSGPKVQSFPIQGQTHVARNQTHPEYNSKPPTSGWHWGDAVAPPGISRDPIPNEIQVHNLEHGEIMVQYDCPDGCPDIVSQLEAIVRTYPKKVVMAPYPGLAESGHPIALTSWGKLVYLDNVDEPYIRNFIARNKDKAPEYFPD